MISLQKIITKLKSLIDKNTADITALNSGFAAVQQRYLFKTYVITGTGLNFFGIYPPSEDYRPVCATNGDWATTNIKVTQIVKQGNTATVILDSNLPSGQLIRIDVLWAKGYDN